MARGSPVDEAAYESPRSIAGCALCEAFAGEEACLPAARVDRAGNREATVEVT
jgi:hypothetical protein